MLLDFAELMNTYNLDPWHVVHAGAHLAEEAPMYAEMGSSVMWVEALPELIPVIEHRLEPYPQQRVKQGLLTNVHGERRKFNVTNHDSMSSSIFEFGTHQRFSPEIQFVKTVELETTTIDAVCYLNDVRPDTLVLDLQGAELLALRGARVVIGAGVEIIYTEVNVDEVYVGCAKLREIDFFLGDTFGFVRTDTMIVPGQGWGDALYIRSELV